MNGLKGWKTVIFNLIAMVASLAALYGIDITAEQQASIGGGIIALLTVGNLILRTVTSTPIGLDRQKGFANPFMLPVILTICSMILVSCALFQKPTSCEKHYSDAVYVKFCEADLTIEAAKKVIAGYELFQKPPSYLILRKANVETAEAALLQAELIYRTQGLILAGDEAALSNTLNLIEVWLYES